MFTAHYKFFIMITSLLQLYFPNLATVCFTNALTPYLDFLRTGVSTGTRETSQI